MPSLIVLALITSRDYDCKLNNQTAQKVMQENKIGEIRTENRITQYELASALGWGQSRISGYETGAREPRIKDARKIVSALRKLGAKTHFDEVFPE